MSEPTDADRQRAREIVELSWAPNLPDGCVENAIAAAIAAARAEGLEMAAQYVQRLTEEQSTIRRHQTAEAIRALKEPGHGK